LTDSTLKSREVNAKLQQHLDQPFVGFIHLLAQTRFKNTGRVSAIPLPSCVLNTTHDRIVSLRANYAHGASQGRNLRDYTPKQSRQNRYHGRAEDVQGNDPAHLQTLAPHVICQPSVNIRVIRGTPPISRFLIRSVMRVNALNSREWFNWLTRAIRVRRLRFTPLCLLNLTHYEKC